MATTYVDPIDRTVLLVMASSIFAPVDGSTYASHFLADPLPGSIARRVLLQIGVGDVSVSNVASFVLARGAGIPMTVPSPEAPWGVVEVTDPAPSGLTVFSFPGVDRIPPGAHDPGADTISHEAVRAAPTAHAEVDEFLAPDGLVVHPCTGACDPD